MPHNRIVPQTLCLTAACALSFSAAQAYELKLGTNLPPVDIHGFASQGFLYSSDYNYLGDTTRGSFRFTEAGFNVAFNPLPRTRIAAQAFLFDVGGIGEYEPFLDYASIEYTFNDYIGIRAGRVRKPGGIYNHIQDVDLARTWVLLPQGLYDARWRDFSTSLDGGEVFGNVSLSKAGSASYEAFGGFFNVKKDGGVGQVIQNLFWEESQAPGGPNFTLDNIKPAPLAGIQLWWNTPLDGLRFGYTFNYVFNFDYDFSGDVTLPFPPPFDHSAAVGKAESHILTQQASVEYVWKSLTLQAEYQNLAIFGDTTVATTSFPAPASTMASNSRSDSWYISAAYRFNKWLEAGTYYGEYYTSTKDRDGSTQANKSDGAQKDWAFLSLRFDPTDWLILKAEGHYIQGTALLRNSQDNPDRNNNGWFMLATKATISF